MNYKIIPSLISNNQKELDFLLTKYKNKFNYFQMDVMDGEFVYNKSNWYKFKLPKENKYEAHLMIVNPDSWVKKNYKNFDVIIANFERVKDPLSLIKFVKNKKKQIGFAVNPETSIMHLAPYYNLIDRILILTVHPGKYGASFLPEMLDKIKMLRMEFHKDIEIDGHIDPETIKLCKQAGANLFVVGSYLKEAKNLEKASKKLKKVLN
jgi:ribulose-phosphate 3-epimerase